MKTGFQLIFAVIIALYCCNGGVAQSLENIRVGHCSASEPGVALGPPATERQEINTLITAEERRGLVIDSRPFAVNQTTGKVLFERGAGHVSVTHMNPFVYSYRISVAQQELISTAVSDFIKLLLPPSLSTVPVKDFRADASLQAELAAPAKLRQLELRLNLAACNAAAPNQDERDACLATNEMLRVFRLIEARIAQPPPPAAILPLFATLDFSSIMRIGGGVLGTTETRYRAYVNDIDGLRNDQLHAFDSCFQAQQINTTLAAYDFQTYFNDLNRAQEEIDHLKSLAEDLMQLTTAYNNDDKIKTQIVRCSGFNCTGQFAQYATAVQALLGEENYQGKLNTLRARGQEMQNMFELTQQMRNREGLFARTFDIEKKFELSAATISLKRVELKPREAEDDVETNHRSAANSRSATAAAASGGNSFGATETSPEKTAAKNDDDEDEETEQPEKPAALIGDVNEVIQIGRPRFLLSAGLVYSPLPRRTFDKVQGFVLDAQGNPTGNGDANVVGLTENSPRRLFPMLFLNSRLLDSSKASLYFSIGVTGKKDDNFDFEYLIGPSVSFLNDRALFTFGAYGGHTQNLVNDVKIGDAIPDSLGDAEFYRKRITWKPGFSFSYSFSSTKKGEASFAASTSPKDELKNEIRIGSIPFNLALGMAFTSLEQRTYNEIAGLARDRQGNLTNGQTLARIVGVTSSSNYRLSPLAMLHTRLTNFGRHDFYFTSGITGKKTDDDFDVEYLLGGSFNVYRRKVFLTFGTFIGKQNVLGGNFFEGQALDTTQTVTTERRYVWKPAFAFSYDISRIISRPAQ
jgi:hypothetical protein